MHKQVSRLRSRSMRLKWGARRGEGMLEVPFGRFLEAILTLDLALDSNTQGDSDTLPGLVHS